MTQESTDSLSERMITPLEGMFYQAPYAIVCLAARIKGSVSEPMLRDAVDKLQHRHAHLRHKIVLDDEGVPWFRSRDLKPIPIEMAPRKNDQEWIRIIQEQSQIPFDFDQRPPIRFLLVQSPSRSELVIFCHHVICDGMSLAYLARDLLVELGEPSHHLEVLPDPIPIDQDNLPPGISLNALVKFFVERINKKWRKDKLVFDQQDYQDLSFAYWTHFKPQMQLIELDEKQTSALVENCRQKDLTVNSALTVALAAAQLSIQGKMPCHDDITVAGSLRDRLDKSPGEAMGFFAGAVSLKFKFNDQIDFWENTRKFNQRIQPLYNNKNLFKEPLIWSYLDPGILSSLSFKMIGGLVPKESNRHEKLSQFSHRQDVISDMLKREKMDSFENPLIGTAVTNLTRLDFPSHYGELELERMYLKPGGAYPLVFVNLLAGVVTCSGKLSLVVEYDEGRIDSETVSKICDQTLSYLGVH